MKFNYASSSTTHVGNVRSHNEDSYLERADQGLWVIADGMGGHDAGDFASQLIIQTIKNFELNPGSETFTEEVKSALYSVNNRLIELGEKHERVNGSTVVAMMVNGNMCDFTWAGDSRLYQLRDNQLVQLTKDHSQAEAYVDMGMLTPEEASTHVSSNLLTRCIGVDRDLQLESGTCELKHNDRYLLSSDGLDKHVSIIDIEKTLNENQRDDALGQLVTMALNDGGTDNITITIVDIMNQ